MEVAHGASVEAWPIESCSSEALLPLLRGIYRRYYNLMAPPRGLSTPRALKVNKNKITQMRHEIDVFLTDLHHTLHARSCNHFLWLPHTPKPPRPFKAPNNFSLLFAFPQLLLLWLTL